MLTNNFNSNENIYMEMLAHYDHISTLIQKLDFIEDLKLVLQNPKLIEAIPIMNFKWLLRLSLSLCISVSISLYFTQYLKKNTQKEIRFDQSQ